MQEELLGYLLGALDEAEHARVEAALASDPELARQCELLKARLEPLEDLPPCEPPGRLAQRTIAIVAACRGSDRISGASGASGATGEPSAGHQCFSEGEAFDSNGTCDVKAHHRTESLGSRGSRWTLMDVIVAGGVCAAAAMLFVPAIANSRQQAKLVSCQNNLRNLGVSLVRYSRDHDGAFPLVPDSQKLGVSGIYAPLLKQAQLIENDNWFVCPASRLAAEPGEFRVPSSQEVLTAEGKRLELMQRRVGGSYGYAFGYVDDEGKYCPNINRNRPRFALLADAPSLHLADRQSANHGGCGQNVLFEDGHVEYLKCCRLADSSDNVFVSDRGYVEAGRHFNDSVIAESAATPMPRRNPN